MAGWSQFKETLKEWCLHESNDAGLTFEYSEQDDGYSRVTIIRPDKKKCALMINETLYERMNIPDIDICANITQSLRDKFRANSRRRYHIPT